jgi:MoaA/NifB/PqqE/SkfB family radical SAM enzyme
MPQYALLPDTVVVIINNKCNLKCKMCDLGSQQENAFEYRNIMSTGDMPIELFKKFVDSVAYFKPEIFIVCVEPTVYPHLVDAVKYAHDHGLKTQITTNGVLLKQLASPLLDAGIGQINVSVDADNAELHDSIRGVKGTFKTVLEGIDEVLRLKKSKNSKLPRIGIAAAITNYNFSKLEDIVRHFMTKEIDFINFSHYTFITKQMAEMHNKNFKDIPVTAAHVYEADPSAVDPEIVKNQIHNIKKNCTKINKDIGFTPRIFGNDIIIYYTKHLEPLRRFNRCYHPWKYSYLLPNGDIAAGFKCFNLKMGNISEKDFARIWSDKPYRAFRKRLKKEKLFPSCFRCSSLFSSHYL